jgi:DNA-binding transcriptional LysR family regulator
MKLDQLSYFVEAAKHQHLGKAARVLGVSPSTLSHSISSLEEELGRELFQKQGKALALTLHGKMFARRAADILGTVHQVKRELSSEQSSLVGHFRIGATHGLVSRYLVPAWNEIRRGSAATAEFHSLRSADVIAKVASGELDAGICFNPQYHPHIESEEILKDRTLVCVRPGHPIFRLPKEERLGALPRFPYASALSLPGVASCKGHPVFDTIASKISTEFWFDNFDTARAILEGSEAWAIFPESHRGKLRSAIDDSEGSVQIHLLWQTGKLAPGLERLGPQIRRLLPN